MGNQGRNRPNKGPRRGGAQHRDRDGNRDPNYRPGQNGGQRDDQPPEMLEVDESEIISKEDLAATKSSMNLSVLKAKPIYELVKMAESMGVEGMARSRKLVTLLLQFAERNPGMTRVMVGDALVYENERLQQRMNLFFDKIESALRQNLRESAVIASGATPTVDAQASASAITAFCMGRLQRFARSGFKRSPCEHLEHSLAMLLPSPRL